MTRDALIESLRWARRPVLDKGFVALVDVMGGDEAIVAAARQSFGKGTKAVSDDRTLIRYLMRRHHGTPFEMCECVFFLKVPNGDTWRQMIRHRAAPIWDESDMWSEPSVNAYSYRYSEAEEEFQETPPDAWRLQSEANKQGSGGFIPDGLNGYPEGYDGYGGAVLSARESNFLGEAKAIYKERIAAGVAREQARKDLPNSLYTTAYWKCDLRNIFHFLNLRLDSHAQVEIRAYATAIANIIRPLFPLAFEAFEDYALGAVTLTRLDVEVIRNLDGFTPPVSGDQFLNAIEWAKTGWPLGGSCREREECRSKLVRLGLAKEGQR
jgi:thymidylate synthase (FAD)